MPQVNEVSWWFVSSLFTLCLFLFLLFVSYLSFFSLHKKISFNLKLNYYQILL